MEAIKGGQYIKNVQKKMILCLFDYECNTGFATVSKNIVKHITKHFGEKIILHIAAINYYGPPVEKPDEGICFFSAMLAEQHLSSNSNPDSFGRPEFLRLLHEGEYDGIFIMQDIGVIAPIIPLLQHIKTEKKKKFKSIFYFPIDGELPEKMYNDYFNKDLPVSFTNEKYVSIFENLGFFDLIITYTEYGRQNLLKHIPKLAKKIKVVPHGVDVHYFYPMDAYTEGMTNAVDFGKKYFSVGMQKKEKFIFANINRNQWRKDIPQTIFAFAEAKKNWAEEIIWKPFLYLHMNPKDEMGWDIQQICELAGLEPEDYLVAGITSRHDVEVADLNIIYNCIDCFITTTTGEGWGLTVTEAMACNKIVICPNHTSLSEISGNGTRAVLLHELVPHASIMDNTLRLQANIYEIAEAMIGVAIADQNGENVFTGEIDYGLTVEEIKENAQRYIKTISWADVCKRWIEYFEMFI